jgi:hypothetical protein
LLTIFRFLLIDFFCLVFADLFSVVTSWLCLQGLRGTSSNRYFAPPLAAEHTAKPCVPGLALGFNTYY